MSGSTKFFVTLFTLLILGAAALSFAFLIATPVTIKSPELVKTRILSRIVSEFVQSDGMIMSEPQKTTSESQSYGLLIAVLSDDEELFKRIWKWTKENLQRDDKVFSWVWVDGGVRDSSSATDADQDIAFALYLAYLRWNKPEYLHQAKEVLKGIWEKDTREINGVRVATGGDWALEDQSGVVVNPSYLSPYIYRVFAKIDQDHQWNSLVDSSYQVLNRCSGTQAIARDWCRLEGDIVKTAFPSSERNSDLYSYDAMRTPYRIAVDYLLNKDERAMDYLQTNTLFLKEWLNYKKIHAVYAHNGNPVGNNESMAHYGAQLAAFYVSMPIVADEIFYEKISKIEPENTAYSFYDISWLWFGLHVYTGGFSKFAADQPHAITTVHLEPVE